MEIEYVRRKKKSIKYLRQNRDKVIEITIRSINVDTHPVLR